MTRSLKRVFASALVAACVLPGADVVLSGAPAARFEAGEELPGGQATSRQSTDTRDAFTHASHGISLEGEGTFGLGKAIFKRLWVSAPSSTTSADGLGPLYNARSCLACHLKSGRGSPPQPGEDAVSLILRLSVPPRTDEQTSLLAERRLAVIPDPTYGTQLQTTAVIGLNREGLLEVTYEDLPVMLDDGTRVTLRKPTYRIREEAYGPLDPDVMMSPRVAPQMIGLGLLEAIPDADIRANADPSDANTDGISGRASEVWSADANAPSLGRFGWKATMASIRDQTAAAAAIDIGLSSSLAPDASGDCTERQAICRRAPTGNSEAHGGVELGPDLMDVLVYYSQNLAVPGRRAPQDPDVLTGKRIFHEAGCAACHHPSFTTGVVEGQPHLSSQKIWPYSDLLLHDMGEGLADHRPEGSASGREWRTAPLWGIGLSETVNGHTALLHDGRARSIEEAILWHGGEAEAQQRAYRALSKAEREALIKFVASL